MSLTPEALSRILADAGLDAPDGVGAEPLTGGTYNAAYRIRRREGDDLVLKIAPEPSAPRLSYEAGIMATEEGFYRACAGRLPVPAVVHADYSRTVVDRDLLLMTHRPGTDWHTLSGELSTADNGRLRSELGAHVGALHAVTGDGFGYPQRGLSPTWRTAFEAMTAGLLADAETFQPALPRSVEQIRELFAGCTAVLDDVTDPVLVHFDLWPGNVLVDHTEDGYRIGGIIDGERSFWGDPVAEMVSLALFADIASDTEFLAGYAHAGGRLTFDDSTRTRLALYRAYLYLIMLVEMVPRGVPDPERDPFTKVIAEHLVTALTELDQR
ncbi:phosphotransferase [Actinoplanes sp. NPDC051346]|uniref:phosphotransferase family protein n=1 Tax=Actinoplanes sp. NPDC051346 TaxID=3155048 RepID=UPI0034140B97